jgi:uncharacterized protein YndB with AHSA1/START domain
MPPKEKSKPFDWTKFFLHIAIDAPPEKVFQAWTDDKVVIKWFTVKAEMEPKKKGRIIWEWLGGDKLETKNIDFVPPKKFVFPFGSKGEQVAVTIVPDGNGSVCELRQTKMKTDSKSRISMHMGCKQGWTFFLTNLKSYLEHGVDLRSHDPSRSYNQNFVNS